MASCGLQTSSSKRNMNGYANGGKGLRCSNLSSSSSSGASSSDSDSSETLDVGKPPTCFVTTTTVDHTESNNGDNSSSDGSDYEDDTGSTATKSTNAVKVPQVTLVNSDEFSHGMEVQISPQGRLMQPVPTVRFENLLDDLQYAVWLSFVRECGQVAGNYMHPESPLPGSYWNERYVSFSRLKLFMYDGFNNTPVSLICNKRYFLQINFGIVNDAGHILAGTVIKQGLIGTWFVAVSCNRSSSTNKKPRYQ